MIGHTVFALVLLASPAGLKNEQPTAKTQTPAKVERAEPAILAKARKVLLDGDAKGALALLNPLRKDNPDDPALNLLVGHCQLKLKLYKQAADSFSSILLKDPNQQQAWQGRALALIELGERAKAVSAAQKARQLAPNDPSTYRTLAQIYLHRNNLDAPRAQKSLEKLIQLKPDDHEAHLMLAKALSYQKKVPQAIKILENRLKKNPNDWPLVLKLAESYYATRQLNKARIQIKRLLDAQPDNQHAISLLDAIERSQAYNLWVPIVLCICLPLLFLVYRWLRKGRQVKI